MIGVQLLGSWFWNSDVWLPPNVTWDSFKQPQVVNQAVLQPKDFAAFSDLWYPIPLAFLVMGVRHLFMKHLFKPLGLRLGLKDNKRPFPPDNQVLDEATGRDIRDVGKLAKRAGMSEIEVSRWLRQRRLASLPSTLQKFCETGWRWLFYSCILVYGITCLWDKPWFWNIHNCWHDYPYHQIDPDVWVYYMVELAFYWSLTFVHVRDVKRKDFWELFVHHILTIVLMSLSWTAHFTRIGTLVLIVHDSADHLLELAKMLKYLKFQKTCDAMFLLFFITWMVTRCGVFPSWILYSTLLDAKMFFGMFPAFHMFNVLLGTLQILSLLWTYLIIKAILKALTKGGMDDTRSDTENSDSEVENNNKKHQ